MRFENLETQILLLGCIEAQVGPQILQLRNIPILDVARALGLQPSMDENSGYEYYIRGYEDNANGYYDAVLYPKLNRWEYADAFEDIPPTCAPDFPGLKSSIELVTYARRCPIDDAVKFLCQQFPTYKILPA